MCRDEESKPGEESLRTSQLQFSLARGSAPFGSSAERGLMFLAPRPTQSFKTRQPAFCLVFSLSRLGRERKALDRVAEVSCTFVGFISSNM